MQFLPRFAPKDPKRTIYSDEGSATGRCIIHRSEPPGQHLFVVNALRVIDSFPRNQYAKRNQPFELPPTCWSGWHSIKGQSSFVLTSITPSPHRIPQQSIKMDELCMSAGSGGLTEHANQPSFQDSDSAPPNPPPPNHISARAYLNMIVCITFICAWRVEVGVCMICFKLHGAASRARISSLENRPPALHAWLFPGENI